MTFGQSIQTCLTGGYARFAGRASRSEYWWFALFVAPLEAAVILAMRLLVPAGAIGPVPLSLLASIAGYAALLALAIPQLAVGARRLHDVGRSGWWLLIGVIPVVGALALLALLVLRGMAGANEFGLPPGGASGAAV